MKKIIILGIIVILIGIVLYANKGEVYNAGRNVLRSMNEKKVTSQKDAIGFVWGIDLSHHQQRVDWDLLVAENQPDFIFLKCSEGKTHRDTKYKEYKKEAKKRGIPTGAYHFFSYQTSGKAQAENFIKNADLQKGDLFPVLDIEYKKKKDGTLTTTLKSFEGRLIPKAILISEYFSAEQEAIDKLSVELGEIASLMETMIEEHGNDDGLLSNVVDKSKITKDRIKKRIKEIKDDDNYADEIEQLQAYQKLMDSGSSYKAALKEAQKALDEALFKKYPELTLDEIKHLVIDEKWCGTIGDAVEKIYTAISNGLAARILELYERYEETLPSLKEAVNTYESKVEAHLKRMGFVW